MKYSWSGWTGTLPFAAASQTPPVHKWHQLAPSPEVFWWASWTPAAFSHRSLQSRDVPTSFSEPICCFSNPPFLSLCCLFQPFILPTWPSILSTGQQWIANKCDEILTRATECSHVWEGQAQQCQRRDKAKCCRWIKISCQSCAGAISLVQQSSAPSHAPSQLLLTRRCLQRSFLFVGGSGLAQAAKCQWALCRASSWAWGC